MGSGRDRDSALLLEGGQQVGFYSKIEESGWLRHLRLLLITSTVAAERMHFENSSVLIHCSDGWYVRAHSCVCVCVFKIHCTAFGVGFTSFFFKNKC
jgi:hypothetical protein